MNSRLFALPLQGIHIIFMTIQQLEYIVAVDLYRHFGKAAAACYVTQPTLSMMIQKLEEELNIKLFDRSRKPVVPTELGTMVINQARIVLRDLKMIPEILDRQKLIPEGTLHIGIIPTIAPYLIPLFIKDFLSDFPNIQLSISEFTTDVLLENLKKGNIDVGILVTPLQLPAFREIPLYYEKFLIYSSEPSKKQYLLPEDIQGDQLWLLEEGHCFRTQIMKLCELQKQSDTNLHYAAGSIETLIRLVDTQNGVTILPELATHHLNAAQKTKLLEFADPVPMREVSLVTDRDHVKKHLIDLLKESVLKSLPNCLTQVQTGKRVGM